MTYVETPLETALRKFHEAAHALGMIDAALDAHRNAAAQLEREHDAAYRAYTVAQRDLLKAAQDEGSTPHD
ncbi:hypothetical protein [Caulobacter phage KcrB]|nr:hypothetical protein RW_GP005c [Caulobacter phage RW]WCA46309.1 hypothetical protein [Caulobacter phage KcrB]WCD56244.1 hypothetical protein [Caulobacter phage RLK]WNV48036.1 hypothetical protein GB2A_gp004c [Caulobacter phage GB2A]QDH50462.1 hypothetical protein RW_GP101c [Caulobacter phage RW]